MAKTTKIKWGLGLHEQRKRKLCWSLRATSGTVECAPLEPVKYVERELVSPNGTVVKVRVPVYPLPLASQAAEKS